MNLRLVEAALCGPRSRVCWTPELLPTASLSGDVAAAAPAFRFFTVGGAALGQSVRAPVAVGFCVEQKSALCPVPARPPGPAGCCSRHRAISVCKAKTRALRLLRCGGLSSLVMWNSLQGTIVGPLFVTSSGILALAAKGAATILPTQGASYDPSANYSHLLRCYQFE